MSKNVKPCATELCQVEEAGQIFDTRETLGHNFICGSMVEGVTTLSALDWAKLEKTSSAGVIPLGSRTLQAYRRKQEDHCKEADLHAAAL